MRVIGRRCCRRRGLSLAESMLAITILPLAVTAISYAVVAGQQQALELLRQERASILAEALMEEILSHPYDDPNGGSALGPESGETSRTLWDNADDYHNFSEAEGALKDAAGNLYPSEYQGFSRSVVCAYTTITMPSLGNFSRPALRIDVTVSDAGGPVATLTRLMLDP
jgi:MSHA pilin protein MshD